MKFTRLLFFFFLFTAALQAQKYDIRGKVLSNEEGVPLESATVMLLNAKDSSLVNFGRPNAQGAFEIKNVNPKDGYLLRITFIGYDIFDQAIPASIAENPYDVGEIRMKPASTLLGEATIEAEAIPVQIKKDTIEFNAKAFKTQENDDVEALLKKLPGVEVDREGNVTAQGEQVQRVFVDGKEFFGNDPKLALKNLPAKAIDKVQVYNKKSDQAVFSGIDDGVREKTLNLTLKKDFKEGLFGSATGAYGTDDRYEGRLNLNRFREAQQLSILAMGNNINKQGFSVQDYMSFTGMARQMGRGGAVRVQINGNDNEGLPLDFGNNQTGFTKTWAGGLNFNNEWNKKTEVNGSYLYNNADRFVKRDLTRQNFLPNGNYTSLQNASGNNVNESHRINFTLDHKIDSLNSIKLTSRVGYSQTDQNTDSYSKSLNEADLLQNDGERHSFNGGDGVNVNSELLYRHRFNKRGRSLSTTLTLGLNDSQRDGGLNAVNRYYTNGNTQVDSITQVNTQDNNTFNYGADASYTEPLGKRRYLEFNYAFNQNNNNQDREVYDTDNGERKFNANLSNKFDNTYTYHRGGANFKISKTDWNFNLGAQVQQTNLDGKLLLQNVNIKRSFTNFLPNIRFNRDFTTSKHLLAEYETNINEPSIDQLSPVIDNSDPLNISTGNPNLKPEYAHRFNFNFVTFNPGTFKNFFTNLSFTYTQNRIANAQVIDDQLVRTVQPINVDKDYNLNGFFNFGFPIKRPGLRANLNSNITWARGFSYINEIENQTERLIANTGIRFIYQHKENFFAELSANLSYNQTSYSIQSSQNQDFINQTYGAEFNWNLPVGFLLTSSLDYRIYNSVSGNGGNDEVPIWNASVSKYVLRKRGELKLSVNDLLNRNIGISRTADVNYLQEERIYSLARYFMVGFTYSLQQLGGGRGPMGGMMRIIRN